MPRHYPDYYDLLKISPGPVSKERIKKLRRTLGQGYHSDLESDQVSTDYYKEVNDACDVLSDPVEKAKFDRFWQDNYSPAAKRRQAEEDKQRIFEEARRKAEAEAARQAPPKQEPKPPPRQETPKPPPRQEAPKPPPKSPPRQEAPKAKPRPGTPKPPPVKTAPKKVSVKKKSRSGPSLPVLIFLAIGHSIKSVHNWTKQPYDRPMSGIVRGLTAFGLFILGPFQVLQLTYYKPLYNYFALIPSEGERVLGAFSIAVWIGTPIAFLVASASNYRRRRIALFLALSYPTVILVYRLWTAIL